MAAHSMHFADLHDRRVKPRLAATARALQYAFRTSERGLEANREGRLADEQFRHLLYELARPLLTFLLALLIWLTAWIFYACILLKFPMLQFLSEVCFRIGHPWQIWAGTALLGAGKSQLIAGCASASFYLLAWLTLYRIKGVLALDLLRRRVLSSTSRVDIEKQEDPNGVAHYYYVLKGRTANQETRSDELRFEVTELARQAIDEGGLYTVYYLPRSNVAVAAEPVT